MKIYIVRHGQTDWNKQGIIQGTTDIPLNETGEQQALLTKQKLENVSFDCIYCSPLLRAKQTAEIINKGNDYPFILDDRLYERNFGLFEGSNVKEINFREFWDLKKNSCRNEEEKAIDFFNRVHAFLNDIVKLEYDNVLIVAHGGVSLPVYSYFCELKEDYDYAKYMLQNCEVACYDTVKKEKCVI